MAANPKLIDLSGIGGYPISFLDGHKTTGDLIINSITNSFLSITIPEEHNGTWIYRWRPTNTYNNTNYILNVDYNTNVENPSLYIICTKDSSINNAQRLYKGDNNHLTLFSTRESSELAQAALYSFILFNKTLTTKEINWVKENLIEGDIEL